MFSLRLLIISTWTLLSPQTSKSSAREFFAKTRFAASEIGISEKGWGESLIIFRTQRFSDHIKRFKAQRCFCKVLICRLRRKGGSVQIFRAHLEPTGTKNWSIGGKDCSQPELFVGEKVESAFLDFRNLDLWTVSLFVYFCKQEIMMLKIQLLQKCMVFFQNTKESFPVFMAVVARSCSQANKDLPVSKS